MIKQIHHLFYSVPPGGDQYTWATAVNPAKCLLVINGVNYSYGSDTLSAGIFAYAYPVECVWYSFASTSIILGWSLYPVDGAYVSVQIVEYI